VVLTRKLTVLNCPADRQQNPSAIRLLLANGADIDVMNKSGQQPLQSYEVLKEFRNQGRHNVARANIHNFKYWKRSIVVDERYLLRKVII
jgi:hypothetical protein